MNPLQPSNPSLGTSNQTSIFKENIVSPIGLQNGSNVSNINFNLNYNEVKSNLSYNASKVQHEEKEVKLKGDFNYKPKPNQKLTYREKNDNSLKRVLREQRSADRVRRSGNLAPDLKSEIEIKVISLEDPKINCNKINYEAAKNAAGWRPWVLFRPVYKTLQDARDCAYGAGRKYFIGEDCKHGFKCETYVKSETNLDSCSKVAEDAGLNGCFNFYEDWVDCGSKLSDQCFFHNRRRDVKCREVEKEGRPAICCDHGDRSDPFRVEIESDFANWWKDKRPKDAKPHNKGRSI